LNARWDRRPTGRQRCRAWRATPGRSARWRLVSDARQRDDATTEVLPSRVVARGFEAVEATEWDLLDPLRSRTAWSIRRRPGRFSSTQRINAVSARPGRATAGRGESGALERATPGRPELGDPATARAGRCGVGRRRRRGGEGRWSGGHGRNGQLNGWSAEGMVSRSVPRRRMWSRRRGGR